MKVLASKNHAGVHNIQGIDEQRIFRKPSPSSGVVHVLSMVPSVWE